VKINGKGVSLILDPDELTSISAVIQTRRRLFSCRWTSFSLLRSLPYILPSFSSNLPMFSGNSIQRWHRWGADPRE